MKKLKKIGVFDSGVGGLTVLKELLKEFPHFDYFYFGDTARVPYGIRSSNTIKRFSLQGCLFLQSLGVDLIVVACNSASSTALAFLKNKLSIPLVGVIEPVVKYLFNFKNFKRVGVIGTSATISSLSYERAIKKKSPSTEVVQKACPLFVPLVEEGLKKGEIVEKVIDYYLKELKGQIEVLILGCTHYPLLKNSLHSYFGEEVLILDSAPGVINFLKNHFNLEEETDTDRRGEVKYFVTDAPEKFKKVATNFMKNQIQNVEQVKIDFLEELLPEF